MLKPNADSGYIRPAHDRLGLVCSGSFLQLSLFYIIHRLPIHKEAGSLLSFCVLCIYALFGIIRLHRLGFSGLLIVGVCALLRT